MPPRLRAPSSRMLEPLFVLVLQLSAVCIQAQLLVGFYDSSCPRAESIVQQSVMMAIQSNRPLASRLVRLFFHDCFVQGCDASILLDSTPNNTAEKDSRASATVGGYEVIDAAKNTLEAVCPGTVSCADVVALAARDAIFFSGGPHWDVPTGRRDGLVSQASVVASNLPDPSFNVDQSTASFSAKGLSQSDLVVLSGEQTRLGGCSQLCSLICVGAHTIGFAHCGAIMNRFSANGSDPTLDPTFGKMLESSCPSPSPDATKLLPLDVLSNTIFDNAYFVNLQAGKGLMSSDQALFTDPRTKPLVNAFAQNANSFSANFQLAMVRLGQVQVKTGSDGQIRKNCRAINS
ncbi:peroxidase 5 isoform X1 [Selaginella moellendorffii]|uniref:peroxidase 5 isoform X1 n=1 Tax=Selaginella moellendorffii TaxID=88036 RepID=UPI000D1CE985|nr:peroxidase 5 isoform X1 [Selaginella moellendorffii]|eukprot:XP_024521240.1 peroxidase 5 isoform X1 [Selaginella moellendorffii]